MPGLPFDELYLSFDKVTRCQEIAIDVLVDDSPVNRHLITEAEAATPCAADGGGDGRGPAVIHLPEIGVAGEEHRLDGLAWLLPRKSG